MITVSETGNVYDLRGLSTDEKPTERVGNGSTFFEMDTGKVFMFDLDGVTWREI